MQDIDIIETVNLRNKSKSRNVFFKKIKKMFRSGNKTSINSNEEMNNNNDNYLFIYLSISAT